jgi:hypothetical protein
VRNHREELANHRGASDLLIWRNGVSPLHAELQPEERQHREKELQNQDLAAQIWPFALATGHDGPNWAKATTSIPRPENYTPAATPYATPADRAAGEEGEKPRKAREDSSFPFLLSHQGSISITSQKPPIKHNSPKHGSNDPRKST